MQKKKAKKKAKKAAHKVQEESKKALPASEDKGLEAPAPKDEDPDGIKALSVPDGLERAAKLLQPIISLPTKNIDVWIATYDVAVRRKKYLQALKALKFVHSLDAEHPDLHTRLVDLRQTLTSLPQLPPEPIGPLVTDALSNLLPTELSLETFNSQYLQRNASSPRATLAVAHVAHKLGAPEEELNDMVFSVLNPHIKLDIKDASRALTFLSSIKSSRTNEFQSRCDAKFELSTMFKTSAEQEDLRKQVLSNSIEGGEQEVFP